MAEALIDASSSVKYNLLIEGTLRTSEVPIKTATLLRERDYGVSIALMAVKPEISLISCRLRYEQMRIAGTVPRAVDPKHHRIIVENIAIILKLWNNRRCLTALRYIRVAEHVYIRATVTKGTQARRCGISFSARGHPRRKCITTT